MLFIKNYLSANCKTGLWYNIHIQFIKNHINPVDNVTLNQTLAVYIKQFKM